MPANSRARSPARSPTSRKRESACAGSSLGRASRAAASAAPARWPGRSRPKASLPDELTMKFRLLFWMRGNGRAGSSTSGAQHRLDLAPKYAPARRAWRGSHSRRTCRSTPPRSPAAARRSGTILFRDQRACASSWIASSWLDVMPSGPRASSRAPAAASCRQRGSRRTHRGWPTKCTGTAGAPAAAPVVRACASTRLERQQREFAVDVECGGVERCFGHAQAVTLRRCRASHRNASGR